MILYNIGIHLLGFGIRIASLFNKKAGLWVRGRKNLINKIKETVDTSAKTVWIHCASLGEFEQGRPLIEGIKRSHPDYKIVLTFYSPSGYEMRKNYSLADHIFYLPSDTPLNARKFVAAVKPEIAIFIKYEFWLNYLTQLHLAGTRIFSVSAIFRKDSVFFKSYGTAFRRVLSYFEKIFVQDEQSVQLLASIGINNTEVAGDTRFDRVYEIASDSKELPVIERFSDGKEVFIAGSTWPADEQILFKLYETKPGLKCIIVPHEIGEDHISAIVSRFGNSSIRYSQVNEATDLAGFQVMVVDTMGMLSSIYKYGKYGYIGGGFGAGIHNTLEAAVYGLPLAFGPNYAKFKEARELISLGVATSVNDENGLESWFLRLSRNPQFYAEAKAKALSYVEHNRGATKIVLGSLFGEIRF